MKTAALLTVKPGMSTATYNTALHYRIGHATYSLRLTSGYNHPKVTRESYTKEVLTQNAAYSS